VFKFYPNPILRLFSRMGRQNYPFVQDYKCTCTSLRLKTLYWGTVALQELLLEGRSDQCRGPDINCMWIFTFIAYSQVAYCTTVVILTCTGLLPRRCYLEYWRRGNFLEREKGKGVSRILGPTRRESELFRRRLLRETSFCLTAIKERNFTWR
jgi:hypothetical protein